MYKQRFHSIFYDIDNNKISVQIYINVENDIILNDEELLLSSDPIQIKYVSDDIFKPLKLSGCTINVLTNNILTDLYTGELNKVMLKVFKNDTLFWYGFLTPNIYSSEYESNLDLLQLEFIDVISNLENVKFAESGNSISSFYSVITNALNKIDPTKNIKNIYLHSSLSVDEKSDILNSLYIQERNFYDEGKEPQTYKSVIEDILRYLGMSLIQYRDSYFILDYEALKDGVNNFIDYDIINNNVIGTTIILDNRDLNSVGIANSNATISLGGVYNQISVVANNNPFSEVLPELFDDLINQNVDQNNYYTSSTEENVYLTAYFNSNKGWKTNGVYEGDTKIVETTLQSLKTNITKGTIFQKSCSYKIEDGKPSSLSWKNYLTMIETGDNVPYYPTEYSVKITQKNTTYKNGYFILDIGYLFSESPIPDYNEDATDITFYNRTTPEIAERTYFSCRLQIGNYYYNGSSWTLTPSSFGVVRKNKPDDKIFNTTYHIENTVSFENELVDSSDGLLIKLPDFVLSGDLTFELYRPKNLGNYMSPDRDKESNKKVKYCHISDFTLKYTIKDESGMFSEEKNDKDVLYKNEISSNNITEFNDIILKVNTYSSVANSYSYVIKKDGDDYDFVDKLNKIGYLEDRKMEEFIIEKYYNHYSYPKYIYTNTINNKDLKPYTIIRIESLDKYFVLDSYTYYLKDNSVDVNLTEV